MNTKRTTRTPTYIVGSKGGNIGFPFFILFYVFSIVVIHYCDIGRARCYVIFLEKQTGGQ